MPTSNPVMSGPTLTAGLKATFADAYKHVYEGFRAKLSKVMRLALPSDAAEEIYGYYESAPYPGLWKRGDEIKSEAFDSKQFSVVNHDFGRRIQWHRNDRMDDKTGTLFQRARELGAHWASLPERIFFQMLTGAASAELLPAVPLAADGSAFFAASRFGHAGGNIVTGSGVGSVAAIHNDFFTALGRFVLFQDTQGEPMFDHSILDRGVTVICSAANLQVMSQAFKGGTVEQTVSSTTNIVRDAGYSVDLWPTARLTDNDFYVVLNGSEPAAFEQIREALQEETSTMDAGGDFTHDTGEEFLQYHDRRGYGILLPNNIIQVNN